MVAVEGWCYKSWPLLRSANSNMALFFHLSCTLFSQKTWIHNNMFFGAKGEKGAQTSYTYVQLFLLSSLSDRGECGRRVASLNERTTNNSGPIDGNKTKKVILCKRISGVFHGEGC